MMVVVGGHEFTGLCGARWNTIPVKRYDISTEQSERIAYTVYFIDSADLSGNDSRAFFAHFIARSVGDVSISLCKCNSTSFGNNLFFHSDILLIGLLIASFIIFFYLIEIV